jgi:hypothetical protein
VSKTFGYDFEVVGTALGMVYMLGFVFPLILALIIRFHTSHPNATYTSVRSFLFRSFAFMDIAKQYLLFAFFFVL